VIRVHTEHIDAAVTFLLPIEPCPTVSCGFALIEGCDHILYGTVGGMKTAKDVFSRVEIVSPGSGERTILQMDQFVFFIMVQGPATGANLSDICQMSF